jgi:polysaccharide biosynthesis protein VpsQ
MNRIRLLLLFFCSFLGLVIYAADIGVGSGYWGWLRHVPMGDKICHFGFMFTLSVLSNLALKCRAVSVRPHALLLGTVIVAIVVVGEEISQIWIPGRNFDLLDLTADFIGIACGELVARRLYPVLSTGGDRSRDCIA